MGDVVNLNKTRKARDKREAQMQAEENRIRFGLPKAAKAKLRQDGERAHTDLDGKKLD